MKPQLRVPYAAEYERHGLCNPPTTMPIAKREREISLAVYISAVIVQALSSAISFNALVSQPLATQRKKGDPIGLSLRAANYLI